MVKIACISDTHNQHNSLEIPECDILIHSGDFSYTGKMVDIIEINNWFGKLKKEGKVKEIIAVAGNHDWICELNPSWTKEAFTNCIYLDDSGIELMGLKIWGSPVQPEFCSWAFNRRRGAQIARHWAKIPDDTQILVTHGPPMGILDAVYRGVINGIEDNGKDHVGCEELRKRVDQLKELRLHCFGHIHCSAGEYTDPSGKLFVNAAICTEEYKPTQKPHIINL